MFRMSVCSYLQLQFPFPVKSRCAGSAFPKLVDGKDLFRRCEVLGARLLAGVP